MATLEKDMRYKGQLQMHRREIDFPGTAIAESRIPGFVAARRLAYVILIAAFVNGCASLPPGSDFPKTESSALENPERTRLGRSIEKAASKHKGKSGFRLLPVGIDGFLTRLQMINAAERTLDIQYFIFQGDATGNLLTDAMLRAADRGVRVRVLIDDADISRRDSRIKTLGTHPRIEIRIFNPFAYRGNSGFFRFIEFMLNASRLDYRMHNKLLIVDNTIALAGGRNIGDEYFQVGAESQFGDYDVFAAGPIVRKLSATFDDYWKSTLAIPIRALAEEGDAGAELEAYRQALNDHRQDANSGGGAYARRTASGEPLAGLVSGRLPLVWAHAQVVCDSPDKKRVENGEMIGKLMHREVADTAAAVQSELLIVSPYFIPGDDGMRLIKDLRARNVRVRVLTNSLESSDELWPLMAYAGYARYRLPLLKAGVGLYEVRPVLGKPKGTGNPAELEGKGRFALHAKVFVFDRRKLFVGSMNFDQRSMRLNTEIGLIIDSPELARQAAARFESITQPANSYVLALREDGSSEPHLVWRTQQDGKAIEYDKAPARDAEQRAKVEFFSLLPMDDEL